MHHSLLHIDMFLIFFSLYFIICWFPLFSEQNKSIKIFFYEIKMCEQSRSHYDIAQNTYLITYLNEEHVHMDVSCFCNSTIHTNTVGWGRRLKLYELKTKCYHEYNYSQLLEVKFISYIRITRIIY